MVHIDQMLLSSFLLGAARATVCGLCLVSSTGKLMGCPLGVRSMCAKAGADILLGVLACLFMVGGAGLAAGLTAVAIGSGGWLRERITKNSVCNCFGVLTSVFHPWRNTARLALFVSGWVLILLGYRVTAADAGQGIGAVSGLALVLTCQSLIIANSFMSHGVIKPRVQTVEKLAPGTISPDTVVGSDMNGHAVALRDLIKPGSPLLVLMVMPDCKACRLLKAQLEPLIPNLPVPLFIVVGAGPTAASSPNILFDPQGSWRKTLGVKSVPSLTVIEPNGRNLVTPVAMGAEAILEQLLRFVVTTPAAACTQEGERAVQLA